MPLSLLKITFFIVIILSQSCTPIFKKGTVIPAKNQPTEIAFTEAEKLIIIKAKINGVDGKFLFDNGFSLSAINADFAEKAKVSFQKGGSLTDGNNQKRQSLQTSVNEAVIGSHIFQNTGFYQTNTKKFFHCDDIDGVIGASIINKINWQIDFDKNSIQISTNPFEQEGLIWDISFSNNNSSFVELRVDNQLAKCKIDLGWNGYLKLHKPKYLSAFSGKKAEQKIGMASISAHGFGKVDTTYLMAEMVSVNYQNQSVPSPKKLTLVPLKYAGYVGLSYLKNGLLTINSTQKQYILSIKESEEDSLPKSHGLAIYLVDDVWKVILKNPKNPVMKEVPLLAEIEMLDGEPISRFEDICTYKDYVRAQMKLEKPLKISLKNDSRTFEIPFKTQETVTLK